MRITDKRRGLWFVFEETNPNDGVCSLLLCSYENLIQSVGQFAWVKDMKGIFTNREEARAYFNQLGRRRRYRG